MKNPKFQWAAIMRKAAALSLTIVIVFSLLNLLFYQSEIDFFTECVEIISTAFSAPVEETTSTNYP